MAKVSREHVRWLVLTFAALGLRATGAIVRPPWHDEYFTVWLANGSWRQILDALRLDSGPPLLYAASKLLAVTWAWERLNQIIMRQRGTLGLVLAVALACWSHAFGLILAGTLALAALGMAGAQRWPTLRAGAGGVAAHLPWLPIAATQPPAATEWMVPA